VQGAVRATLANTAVVDFALKHLGSEITPAESAISCLQIAGCDDEVPPLSEQICYM